MKKIILAAAVSFCAVNTYASALEPDTILKVNGAHTVVIAESSEGVTYSVQGSESDSTMLFNYTQKYTPDSQVHTRQSREFHFGDYAGFGDGRWDLVSGGLGFGMVSAAGAPDEMMLEMGKSFEISILNALALKYRPATQTEITFGLGFIWRNYRSTTAPLRMVSGDMNVCFGPWPAGSIGRHTAIKTFAMQFPLMLSQNLGVNVLGSRLKVSAGAILNVSTYASVKSGWTDISGEKVRECLHGVGQRKVSVDFMALFGTYMLSAYVRYSPQTVLTGDVSPRFRTLSAGIMLAF
ncbi:MAG: hypothetical protein K2I56_09000 [Muribaculaceae bacterium]|nr:hypothetical protein [Muribaculaceae bacterium]